MNMRYFKLQTLAVHSGGLMSHFIISFHGGLVFEFVV